MLHADYLYQDFKTKSCSTPGVSAAFLTICFQPALFIGSYILKFMRYIFYILYLTIYKNTSILKKVFTVTYIEFQ